MPYYKSDAKTRLSLKHASDRTLMIELYRAALSKKAAPRCFSLNCEPCIGGMESICENKCVVSVVVNVYSNLLLQVSSLL